MITAHTDDTIPSEIYYRCYNDSPVGCLEVSARCLAGWLGGVRDESLPLLAPIQDQGSWWEGGELTGALGLAPSWTHDSSGAMTRGLTAGQGSMASGCRAQVVSVCAGPKTIVSMNFSASWIW